MIGRGWEFWIDRGGTFTDVVARTPAGELKTLKLLSRRPRTLRRRGRRGHRAVARRRAGRERRVAAVKMGTTVATNALLERRGEPTALVITAGLEDAVRIGGQQRPDIFALDIALPEMLYVRVDRGRSSASTRTARARAARRGAAARATSRPRTPRGCAARRSCYCTVIDFRSTSSPRPRSRARSASSRSRSRIACCRCRSSSLRGDTTLADAYLSPVLDRYVASVRRGLERDSAPRRSISCRATAAHGRRSLPRQGQPVVGARRRRHRHGARRARRRLHGSHRLRHGRHVDGRGVVRRRARAHAPTP